MEPIQKIMAQIKSTAHGCELPSPEEMERLKVKWFNDAAGDRNLEDGYDCKICRNKGMIMDLVEDEGKIHPVTRDCKCIATRNSIMRMRRSGLQNLIKNCTFEKFEDVEPWQKAVKAAAVEFSLNPGGWFFLGGQSGSGKTHLCTAICRKFLLEGKLVQYMLWRDDIVTLKQLANDPDRNQIIDRYKNADVLYVDDLFKTGKSADGTFPQPSTADINIAFEIINYRYNDPDLVTIVSSELSEAELIEIDEATFGRIFERGKTISIAKDRSRNYRLRKAVEI